MSIQQLFDGPVFEWLVLPALIFISRIFDVSLGTIRIIFVSRSRRFLAPLLGFFEVLIWLLAISQIMKNLNNIACYIAYAGGFALGTFVGIILEEKLAIGTLIVRVILVKDECRMRERLYEAGFGVTTIDARGMNGDVKLLYTVIKRKDLEKVIEIIEKCQSKAFYSVEDAKTVKEGIFPAEQSISPFSGRLKTFFKSSSPHYRKQGK